jgi:hypothetical protein
MEGRAGKLDGFNDRKFYGMLPAIVENPVTSTLTTLFSVTCFELKIYRMQNKLLHI